MRMWCVIVDYVTRVERSAFLAGIAARWVESLQVQATHIALSNERHWFWIGHAKNT